MPHKPKYFWQCKIEIWCQDILKHFLTIKKILRKGRYNIEILLLRQLYSIYFL